MRARAWSGVTSKALATPQMASRRVKVELKQGEGQRPGIGSAGSRAVVVSEIPVIHRHAVLARQDPKHCLGVLRSGRGGGFLAEDSVQVIDSGRAGATLAIGNFDRRELLGPSCAQHVLAEAASGLSFTSGKRSLRRSGS